MCVYNAFAKNANAHGCLTRNWCSTNRTKMFCPPILHGERKMIDNEEQARAPRSTYGEQENKDPICVDGACVYVSFPYIIEEGVRSQPFVHAEHYTDEKQGGPIVYFWEIEMWRSRFEKRGVGAQTRNCQCHCNEKGGPFVMIPISHLCSFTCCDQ